MAGGSSVTRWRSATHANKVGQHTSDEDEDVPEPPLHLQTPPKLPEKTLQRLHKDAHAECVGEGNGLASHEGTRSSVEAHTLGMPGHDNDAINYPNDLQSTPERVSKGPEQQVNGYAPGRVQGADHAG